MDAERAQEIMGMMDALTPQIKAVMDSEIEFMEEIREAERKAGWSEWSGPVDDVGSTYQKYLMISEEEWTEFDREYFYGYWMDKEYGAVQ